MTDGTGALEGVRVLDLTRILAGPFATMMLGDLGADIVKVEPPGGDDSRQWGPPWTAGESAYYLGVNRNKRSIVLNLKQPAARTALLRLIERSDVVIENFKTGTMEKWGLGYEEVLRPRHPGLVYCSITGYGRSGPSAHLPGYDPIIEAAAGLMSITGEPDGEPMKVGVALVDILTGSHVAYGVTAALLHRDRTGQGQRVDLSLLETGLAALANQASAFLISGNVPQRHGNAHPSIVPYQTFDASDRPVMVSVGNDRQFKVFCGLLGAPHLACDARFTTNPSRVENRDVLVPLLQDLISSFNADDLVALAEGNGVPVAPVNTLDRAFAHPQVAARQMLIELEHPTAGVIRQVGFPIKMDRTPAAVRRPPPLCGEHTIEVLREVGLSESEIEEATVGT